jgi:hypothetical protein
MRAALLAVVLLGCSGDPAGSDAAPTGGPDADLDAEAAALLCGEAPVDLLAPSGATIADSALECTGSWAVLCEQPTSVALHPERCPGKTYVQIGPFEKQWTWLGIVVGTDDGVPLDATAAIGSASGSGHGQQLYAKPIASGWVRFEEPVLDRCQVNGTLEMTADDGATVKGSFTTRSNPYGIAGC